MLAASASSSSSSGGGRTTPIGATIRGDRVPVRCIRYKRKLGPFATSINCSAENSRRGAQRGVGAMCQHLCTLCAAPQPTHGLLLLQASLAILDHLDNQLTH